MISIHRLCVAVLFAASLNAQVSSNASLTGKYFFRHVLVPSDATSTISGAGTLTFDGNGAFSILGTQLIGTGAPATLAGSGTYSVKPGGFVTLTNPLRSTATLNARLGVGALVGASTEAGSTTYDMFVAIPAPTQTVSNATLFGSYWISSFELPNGGVTNLRDTNFKLSTTGAGSFAENTATGQARNLGNKLISQSVGPITYALTADGSGSLTFAATDTLTQLIAGTKTIYVSQDGTYFIGGSLVSGIHGIVLGVRAGAASVTGLYYSAGIRYDNAVGSIPARFTATAGSANGLTTGAVQGERTRQSDSTLVFDTSRLVNYTLSADGSATFASQPGRITAAVGGNVYATTGIDSGDATSYHIGFAVKVPPQSGTGVFLHPQGVFNGASFAPPGSPVSPGGFVTMFGSGFGTATVKAPSLPFPTTLGGVQVSVNGTAAPVYVVSPTQISAVVPYSATGSTATFRVTVNGTPSNDVAVPLAATAPGIFSLPQNGLGDAAVLHANFTTVSQSNPAMPGETVQLYLTGLGTVSPTVATGAAAPSAEPFARTTGELNVYIGGRLVTVVQFKGLAPTLAALYQLNIQIPSNLGPGYHPLAIQTPEGYTDMVNIWVALPL